MLFVPGCRPVYRRLFVSVNPFHARHVREKSGLGTISQGSRRELFVFGRRMGYGRCGGSRYSWTRCGGSRIGLSRVTCSDPLWREPLRVGNTGQRNASIIVPGNCLWLSFGLKQSVIVLRRPRVQSLQVVLGDRQTTALLLP